MKKLYFTIFNLIALAAIIYIGIDSFYRVVRARLDQGNTGNIAIQDVKDEKRDSRPGLTDYQVVNTRNIFSNIDRASLKDDTLEIDTLEPTSLKIKLLGTVAGTQENAAAIIEETAKRTQGLYRVGDSVQEAVIKSILRGKVVLGVDNRDEILMMEESDSGEVDDRQAAVTAQSQSVQGLERTITVRRADIEESLANINDLLSQASIRPHFTDDQADGLAVTGIRAGSIFRRMGLRNGDIIQGVNENEISSPDDLISLYNDLRSESAVSLQIERRGRDTTLNYSFRD
ncbi:PDZ domain-containing protein [Deltaproteobacteria bacterium]|nr:PDZ domain-containing protein [Deltaproteobacteria bacterium]